MSYSYIRQPAKIYERSFSIVREEAALVSVPQAAHDVAVRLIHSCGMVDILDDLELSPGAVEAGRAALQKGASVFCDVEMVRSGIIQSRLPSENELVCTLNDPSTSGRASDIGNTRSAAAVDLWKGIGDSVVAIGIAPTALYRLLENIINGTPRPALIVAMPVGFVGAMESKQALSEFEPALNFITVHGRRGGSAMASAVVNALAGGLDQ
jgi:precorrin-8X/cobalt-precorrin-8 methylmutase